MYDSLVQLPGCAAVDGQYLLEVPHSDTKTSQFLLKLKISGGVLKAVGSEAQACSPIYNLL